MPTRLCACGCGLPAPKYYDRHGRFINYVKYVAGHIPRRKATPKQRRHLERWRKKNWANPKYVAKMRRILSLTAKATNARYRREASRRATHHGHNRHGQPTRTYRSWSGMRTRCFCKNNRVYARYGGRGITVCERWKKFENFLEDMGVCPPGRSIDRINNDGNYEPGNCRWATPTQQSRNRRRPDYSRIRRCMEDARTKAEETGKWVAKHASYCGTDKRHLDEGSAERAYWHCGYLAALTDILETFSKSH